MIHAYTPPELKQREFKSRLIVDIIYRNTH